MQWAAHTALKSRPAAGAMVVHVVGVGAVYQARIAFALRIVNQLFIDIGLAEITAIGRISQIARVFCLVTLDQHVAGANRLGDGLCFLQLTLRHAGRDSRQGHHPLLSQRIVCQLEQQGAVDTARIGDSHAFHLLQDFSKSLLFVDQVDRPFQFAYYHVHQTSTKRLN